MDGFTTFVFLHIITLVCLLRLYFHMRDTRSRLDVLRSAWMQYANENSESMNRIVTVLQAMQNSSIAHLGLTEAFINEIPETSPDFADNDPDLNDDDDGEDDGLTTLGDILNQ